MQRQTIFALASGAGRAGVAVVRLSGPETGAALRALTARDLPPARTATLSAFRRGDEVIDRGLVLWFPAPASFTGEDVAELHCHGGRAVLAALLRVLADLPGLRPAEAGEFSRRAFEHGKLDLTEAEGLADLVEAETEMQRRQALRQLNGALGDLYERWRTDLLATLAEVEAAIDFPDDDLPDDLPVRARERAARIAGEIAAHLNDNRAGEIVRDGVSIVVLGAPNVGKSSLINALAGRDVAIVSSRAGTTRDIIEVRLDLGGLPVTIADTAGLRDAEDEIEAEGVRRAVARAERADIAIVVGDIRKYPSFGVNPPKDIQIMAVWNKSDLISDIPRDLQASAVSAQSGEGIDQLLTRLRTIIEQNLGTTGVPLTRERHRLALHDCQASLGRFLVESSVDMAAEDLRMAARALGRITGRVDVEDMLDALFAKFCIGK